MDNNYKPKVGDKLWLHYVDSRCGKDCYMEVKKVGKKFFYLGKENDDYIWPDLQFSLEDFSHCNRDYSGRYTVHKSKEEFEYKVETYKRRIAIRNTLLRYITDEEINTLYNTLCQRQANANNN